MLKQIFFVLLIHTTFINPQEYYYYNGDKISITQNKNKCVLLFDSTLTRNEKNAALRKMKLVLDKDLTNSSLSIVRKNDEDELNINEIPYAIKSIYKIYARQNSKEEFAITNKIVFKIRNNLDLPDIVKNNNLKLIDKPWLGENVYLAEVDSQVSALFIANRLYESGLVEFSHPDFVSFKWEAMGVNDSYYPDQWNLEKIHISDAWDIVTGNSSIIIAVLDCGIQSSHYDIDNNIVQGYDAVNNDYTTEPYDNRHHGTACAGIVSAETNNGHLVAGVSYNCKIMPIQFTYSADWSSSSNFAAGINWAANHGAHIISISGWTSTSDVVSNAINTATTTGRNNKGCIIVVTAGSSNEEDVKFPGRHSQVIAVGASDINDNKRSDSNYGSDLDVMAPGGVFTLDITGSAGATTYDFNPSFGGSSSAAPHVAGLAALILSLNNTLSDDDVREIICYSADDINTTGFDKYTGWGRINAWRALDAINHLTTSGQMIRDEIWFGTVNLTSNVIIPSGVKLTILSNTTVNLNGFSIISAGGTLINQDATITGMAAKLANYNSSATKGYCGNIQTAVNNAGVNDYVYISQGNYNETVQVNNKESLRLIGSSSGTYLPQVYINNSDYAYLSNISTNFVSVTNGSINPQLTSVTMNYQGSDLMVMNGADYFDLYDVSFNNDEAEGILAYNSSGYIQYSDFIYSNNALWVQNTPNYVHVNNTYFCYSTTRDIYASNANVTAANCGFSRNPPPVYGNVYITNPFYPCSGLKVNSGGGSSKPTVNDNQIVFPDDFDKLYHELNKKILEKNNSDKPGISKKDFSEDFSKFEALCISRISSNKEKSSALSAIAALSHFYRIFGEYDKMKNLLTEIVKDEEFESVKSNVKRLLITYYKEQDDFNTALALADEILTDEKKDTALICDILYTKGLIYEYSLNNPETAAKYYFRIINNYPANPMHIFAHSELRLLGYEDIKFEEIGNESEKLEFGAVNYPNPFNPVTIINYSIPTDEYVVIKVYDILGSEVKTLVNEYKKAGTYTVDFDGRSLSSGVYFYTITAGNRSKTNKMMLTK